MRPTTNGRVGSSHSVSARNLSANTKTKKVLINSALIPSKVLSTTKKSPSLACNKKTLPPTRCQRQRKHVSVTASTDENAPRWSATSCSPTDSLRSTIGARGLNFRVRNGSEWDRVCLPCHGR